MSSPPPVEADFRHGGGNRVLALFSAFGTARLTVLGGRACNRSNRVGDRRGVRGFHHGGVPISADCSRGSVHAAARHELARDRRGVRRRREDGAEKLSRGRRPEAWLLGGVMPLASRESWG